MPMLFFIRIILWGQFCLCNVLKTIYRTCGLCNCKETEVLSSVETGDKFFTISIIVSFIGNEKS
jgi:hypothetical protein